MQDLAEEQLGAVGARVVEEVLGIGLLDDLAAVHEDDAVGARVRFSSTVRCGNRLKCWNTMPTSRRTCSICLRSWLSSIPSTMMVPFWCSSRRLMQRIKVDLPEPDGPQMTIRSPL